LYRNLVAHMHNLGTPGDWAPAELVYIMALSDKYRLILHKVDQDNCFIIKRVDDKTQPYCRKAGDGFCLFQIRNF